MRNLGRVTAVMAGLAGASAALALVVAGCGGDDSTTPDASDAKADMVTSDRTIDVNKSDVNNDVKQPDAPPPDVDSGVQDAPPPDVKDFDVGDASFDIGSDVNLTDAPFGVSLSEFPAAVNLAYCQRLEACCNAEDGGVADASGFVSSCVSSLGPFSVSGNLNLANTASPNVVYVPSKAKECLDQLAATPCGTVSAGQSELNYLTCASAIQGQLAVGSGPCTSSFDCASGYCPTDGGTCTALGGVGASCKDTTYSTDCTYLGNGDPLVYCSADGGTCQADLPNGSTCVEYQQCNSQVCFFGSSSSGTCETSFVFATHAFCMMP
jgi:hypothetical protein